MVDQLTTAETCRSCGSSLNPAHVNESGLCPQCAGSIEQTNLAPSQFADPDNPGWGPPTGIAIWMMSVAAILLVPVAAVILWYFIDSARGTAPSLSARNELIEWLKSPTLLLVQVLSTIVAHGITIAICWAVVTRLGKRPFLATLGWDWGGRPIWYWVIFSGCVLLGLGIVTQLLSRFIPQSEDNSFSELLRSSREVRLAIAVLATFSAPIVEEMVYRGILFAGLRRYLGAVATILVVAVMFTGVHVLQYWGAWLSIIGLTLLSLSLTVVRAKTKSVLPCVVIHAINNAFFSVFIILNKNV